MGPSFSGATSCLRYTCMWRWLGIGVSEATISRSTEKGTASDHWEARHASLLIGDSGGNTTKLASCSVHRNL